MIEEAGANSLELNVYFIPTDISLTGRDVEQRYLEILRAVRKAVDIPIAIKLGPYFSSMGQVAMEFANAGADALVLFNRFYQPNVDLTEQRLRNDLPIEQSDRDRGAADVDRGSVGAY
jgi:dihydroorotate dehydrogenase (fumarate)